MSEIKEKKETTPKSKKSTQPKKTQPVKIEEKKKTTPKSEKNAIQEKPQLREIDEKRKEFEQLLAKFKTIDDPIERYIRRQEMIKIQQYLKKHGVQIDIP